MKTVNVAELKARLSKYLGMAHRGETITVTSHQRPIARISPADSPTDLSIQPPTAHIETLQQVDGIEFDNEVNGVAELLRDRQGR